MGKNSFRSLLILVLSVLIFSSLMVNKVIADPVQADCSVSPSAYNPNGVTTWTLTINNNTGQAIKYVDAGEQVGPDINGYTSLEIFDPLNIWTSVPPQIDQSWDSWAYNSTGILPGNSASFTARMPKFDLNTVKFLFAGLYNDVPSGSPVEVGFCQIDTSTFSTSSSFPPAPAPTNPTLSLPSSGSSIATQTFTASGEFIDTNYDAPWTTTVDYGDGTGTQPLSLSPNKITLNHVYAQAGTYNAQVTVTNNAGLTATGTIVVSVAPAPPGLPQADCSVSPTTYNPSGPSTWTLTINNNTGQTIKYVDAGEQVGPDATGATSLAISDPLNVWTSVPPQADQSWDSWAYNDSGIPAGGTYSFAASMPAFDPNSVRSLFAGLYNDVPSGNPVEVGFCNIDTSTFSTSSPFPLAPTNLTIPSPSQNPALSWTASSGASSYNIYRNGTKVGSSTSTSYTDNTSPEGTDAYYVTAVNAGGESGHSNSVNVLVDRTAPTLGTPTWSTNPILVGSGNSTLTVSASDSGSGVTGGEYYIGNTDPGVGNATPMTYGSGNLTASIGANLAAGVYPISIRAKDAAGNWSTPPTTTSLVITDTNTTLGMSGKNKKDLIPSTSNGDVMPGLVAGATDAADYGFAVQYKNGTLDTNNGFTFNYATGTNCGKHTAQNCHTFSLTATSFDWMTAGGTSNSQGWFQGIATVTVDGVTTTNPFWVTGTDGGNLTPNIDDYLMLKVYAPGANPSTATAIYQASGPMAGKDSVKIQ